MIKLPIKLIPVPRFKLFLSFLFFLIFLVILFGGGYYWLKVKKGPSRSVKPEEYITSENLWTYVEPDEETKRGYLTPRRTFKIVERKKEWARIEVYESHFDMTWEGWIKINDTGYQPRE